MRRLQYVICPTLLLLMVAVGFRARPAFGQVREGESKGMVTYSISIATENVPEECTFHFYDGEEKVEKAAQGRRIRVEPVFPKPNQDNWRLLPGTLSYALVLNGNVTSNTTPIHDGTFIMPNLDVVVYGVFVRGLTLQLKELQHGRIDLPGGFQGYRAGQDVVFEVKPDVGSAFEKVEIISLGSGESLPYGLLPNSKSKYHFRMPDSDVQIVPSFVQKEFSITLKVDVDEKGKNSTLLVEKMEGLHYRDRVTVRPRPAYRYRMVPGSLKKRLKSHQTPEQLLKEYDESSGLPFSFLMEGEDMELMVAFERDPQSLSDSEILVQQFVTPTPSSDLRNEVKVHMMNRAVLKPGTKVKEGEKLFVRCKPAPGYRVHAIELLGQRHTQVDSVAFVVPDASTVDVRVYFLGEREKKPDPISGVEDRPHVEVYPNPFSDALTVKADGVSHVELYSVDGTRVFHQPYSGEQMHLPELPSGVYMLYIHFADGSVMTRSLMR